MKKALVPGAFAACCVPALWLAVQLVTSGLGANPIEALLNDLGYITFVLLALTLACTPAQILLGWNWPIRIRKLLGDFCFFYACLHLLTYAGLDQGLDVDLTSTLLDGSLRTSCLRSVGQDPRRNLPLIQRGDLVLDSNVNLDQTASGHFHILFGQGGELGEGRTVDGTFSAVVANAEPGSTP